MSIKWGNIFALAILIALIILIVRVSRALDHIYLSISLPHCFNDPTITIAIIGLICVTIVAVVKIIMNK